MVFFEKTCGVKFLKHGDVVNFLKVVGVDSPDLPLLVCL